MKTYLKDIVNKFKNYSEKLDNFSLLIDQPWIVHLNDISDRCVFIFRRENKELFILTNGVIKKEDEGAKWDYIAPMNSLLIRRNGETKLFNQGFFDESIMILKLDGTNELQLFVNENKIESSIQNLLEQVEKRYSKISIIQKPKDDSRPILYIYQSPLYEEVNTQNSSNILIGNFQTVEIKFTDGLKGKIYRDKNNEYFLKIGWFVPDYFVYKDEKSCINGLHYYLRHGEILKENIKRRFQ